MTFSNTERQRLYRKRQALKNEKYRAKGLCRVEVWVLPETKDYIENLEEKYGNPGEVIDKTIRHVYKVKESGPDSIEQLSEAYFTERNKRSEQIVKKERKNNIEALIHIEEILTTTTSDWDDIRNIVGDKMYQKVLWSAAIKLRSSGKSASEIANSWNRKSVPSPAYKKGERFIKGAEDVDDKRKRWHATSVMRLIENN